MNQSIAEQSKSPVRPRQSARATRASSSRSTFCASRRNAPSPTLRRLVEHARLQMLGDQPDHLLADGEAIDRVDVQPIEQPQRRLDTRLLVVQRPDAAVDHRGRRGLAQVVARARRA